MKKLITMGIIAITLLTSMNLSAKVAQCYYNVEGKTLLNAKCEVKDKGAGSFMLTGKNVSKSKSLGADEIHMNLIQPNVAKLYFKKGSKVTNDGEYELQEDNSSCWISTTYPAKLCVK